MKKIITLFSGLMLTVAVAFGQNYNWAHGYYGSFSLSVVNVLQSPDNNGGVFTAMIVQDSVNLDPQNPTNFTIPSSGGGVAISRIDANKNLVFSEIIDASYYGYYNVYDIQTLSDGSFYLIASIRNAPYPFDIDPSGGVYNINNNCVAISHFDASGNLLSVKELNIETYQFDLFEATLSSTDELVMSGAFYYGAHFSDVTGQDTTYAAGNRTVFTAKYDNNLNLDWVDYFENDRPVQYSTFNYGSLLIKPNGKVVSALAFGSAITLANTNSYTPIGNYDAVIIEYDANGSIINDFVLSSTGDVDYVNTMAVDADNNIAILGLTQNQADIDFLGTNPGATTVQNGFFALYDDGFNLKHFKTASMGNSRPKDCKFNSNGELVVAGRLFGSFDFDFINGGDQFYKLQANGNNYDVFLAKYDTTMNVIYAHNIGNSANYGDVKHLRLNAMDDIFISGESGGGLTDMNFGPLTNEIDGYSTPYGFISKYSLCNTQEITNNVSVCPGDSYTFPDGFTQNNITTSTTRSSRYTGVSSCDSLVTTNVSLYNVYALQDTFSVCAGDSYTFHDGSTQNNITSQVSYQSNLQSVNGCDSIITTTINVINVDTAITQNVNILTVNQNGATYQWYDCGNSQPISGENQQSYEIGSSGDYQVEVTYNGCTLSSSCMSVIFTGLNEVSDNELITIYPNPTLGVLKINLGNENNIDYLRILNIEGKQLIQKTVTKNLIELDVSCFDNGLYLLQLISDHKVSFFKFHKN